MRLLFPFLLVVNAFGQIIPESPSPFFAVRNAATYANCAAPGSFVTVSFFSPTLTAPAPEDTTLELVTSNGQTFRLSVRPREVSDRRSTLWAVIPKDAALGTASATLYEKNTRLASTVLEIAAAAPGLFSRDYSSFGPALAYSYYSYYDGFDFRVNALTAAAIPDHFVALFATGLNGARESDVVVEVAGQPASVTYAGPHSIPGLDQINFLMPKNPYLGCYVPVIIRVRGIVSNEVTLSINSDRYDCAHPLGLSYSDLVTLDAGGFVPLAELGVYGNYVPGTGWAESAQFLPSYATASSVFFAAGTQLPDSAYLSCSVTELSVGGAVRSGLFGSNAFATLSGPDGQQALLKPFFNGGEASEAHLFTQGTWRISTGEFQQSFTLPPAITSISIAPGATIRRDRDLQILWNPVGFGPGDIVTISLFRIAARSSVVCRAQAWSGQLTVPKEVLAPSADGVVAFPRGTEGLVMVSVSPHPSARTQFSIPNQDGSASHAVINYGFGLTVPVKVE